MPPYKRIAFCEWYQIREKIYSLFITGKNKIRFISVDT